MEQEHLSDENTSLEMRNKGISNGIVVVFGVVLAIVVVSVTLVLYSSRAIDIFLETDENITHTSPDINSSTQLDNNVVPDVTLNKSFINGHEYVDLGLSVKWATCNVGASSPADHGDYYAWGVRNKMKGHKKTYIKEGLDNIEGNKKYDVARVKWGGTWRLPTAGEVDELINNCTLEWTVLNYHYGYKVTGPNGNSIFLCADGWCFLSRIFGLGNEGVYWTGTPYAEQDDRGGYTYAYDIRFDEDGFSKGFDFRGCRMSIRPVSD